MLWPLADSFSASLFQIKPSQILPKALLTLLSLRAYESSYIPCGAKYSGGTQQKTSQS